MDDAALPSPCSISGPRRAGAAADRSAAWAIRAAVTVFAGLFAPAMNAYPGGTVWNPSTRGSDFWLNYVSDLQRSVALDGEPNAGGAHLAQAALLVLAAGLVPAWWLLARLFAERPRLGLAVRASGLVCVAGAVGVACVPSDRCAFGHVVANVVVGASGLVGAVLATIGLARRGRCERTTAALGAITTAASFADLLLYVSRLSGACPEIPAIAILERVSLLLVLAWMCAIAQSGARAR